MYYIGETYLNLWSLGARALKLFICVCSTYGLTPFKYEEEVNRIRGKLDKGKNMNYTNNRIKELFVRLYANGLIDIVNGVVYIKDRLFLSLESFDFNVIVSEQSERALFLYVIAYEEHINKGKDKFEVDFKDMYIFKSKRSIKDAQKLLNRYFPDCVLECELSSNICSFDFKVNKE